MFLRSFVTFWVFVALTISLGLFLPSETNAGDSPFCCMCGESCPQPDGPNNHDCNCCPDCPMVTALQEACLKQLETQTSRLIVTIPGDKCRQKGKQCAYAVRTKNIERFTTIKPGACGALELIKEKGLFICENFTPKAK